MILDINGRRYSGKFEIEPRSASGTEEVYTEVGRHPENWRRVWYEGKGMVSDYQTCVRERFLFSPKGQSQEDIIILGKGVSRKAVRDYKGVLDLALRLMHKSAQSSEEPVPTITLPVLTLEMLSEEKLMQPEFAI